MSIVSSIKPLILKALNDLYGQTFNETDLTISTTKPEFEGDYTLVLFSFVKQLRKSPEALGGEIGEVLIKADPEIFTGYNVIKGFLNLTISDNYWINFLQTNYASQRFGCKPANGEKVMVEYSSPNTNKPLHLGHMRNILLVNKNDAGARQDDPVPRPHFILPAVGHVDGEWNPFANRGLEHIVSHE